MHLLQLLVLGLVSPLARPVLSWSWQLPLDSLFGRINQDNPILDDKPRGPRIAIIGAGAGGSSAAYWISKAKERHGVSIQVDVYEKSDYIGGRSTIVYPHDDPSYVPVELGASIFVDANRNIMRAVKEFNLTLVPFQEGGDMGIWDGSRFVLTLGSGGWFEWLDNLRVVWRYGYTSCTRAPKLVTEMVNRLLAVYTRKPPTWKSIESLSEQVGFDELTPHTTEAYLKSKGIDELYIHELLEAASRVNYAQNSDRLHGLLGLVSMAADGAHSVKGGNFQVFENFLRKSDAEIYLNTTVTGLRKIETTRGIKNVTQWTLTTSEGSTPIDPYDHVIIAAPFRSSQVTIVDSPAATGLEEPPVNYVHLHVTLFTTNASRPNPRYFNVKRNVPRTILTTYDAVRHHPDGSVPGPEFNSLSYLRMNRAENSTEGPEWVVKIFSDHRIEDEWLENVVGAGNVGWVYRKEWDSYPIGVPTAAFPPIHPDEGLWYVNAFEPFISTMETETVSARNVVDSLFEISYGSGLCPEKKASDDEGTVETEGDDWGGVGADGKIYGWDC